jgi:hypothetical protein
VVGGRLCLGFGGFLAVVGAKQCKRQARPSVDHQLSVSVVWLRQSAGCSRFGHASASLEGFFCFEQRAKLPGGRLLKDIKLDFLTSLCSRTSPLLLDCMFLFMGWKYQIDESSIHVKKS